MLDLGVNFEADNIVLSILLWNLKSCYLFKPLDSIAFLYKFCFTLSQESPTLSCWPTPRISMIRRYTKIDPHSINDIGTARTYNKTMHSISTQASLFSFQKIWYKAQKAWVQAYIHCMRQLSGIPGRPLSYSACKKTSSYLICSSKSEWLRGYSAGSPIWG